MHNLLVAQSGGPTSAINATLSGVITEAMIQGGIDRIYGGLNGIEGILQEKIIEMCIRDRFYSVCQNLSCYLP